MKHKNTKKMLLRIIAQTAFLGLFIFLIMNKKLQLWMPVFAAGLILSPVFSRFYCGWICPMGTLFLPINWVYEKLGIKRLRTPVLFKKKAARYIVLFLTAAFLIISFKLNIRINILIYITVLSVLVTLFFEESFWHHHICPYGTMLNLSSKPAFLSVKIDEENCTSCGLCQYVCPADSIETLPSSKRYITKNECLACFKCQEVCPVDIIRYRHE